MFRIFLSFVFKSFHWPSCKSNQIRIDKSLTCIPATNHLQVSLQFQLIALCFLHSLVVMAIYVIPGRMNPQLLLLRAALPPPPTEGRCPPSELFPPSIHSRPTSAFPNRPSTLISLIKEVISLINKPIYVTYWRNETTRLKEIQYIKYLLSIMIRLHLFFLLKAIKTSGWSQKFRHLCLSIF